MLARVLVAGKAGRGAGALGKYGKVKNPFKTKAYSINSLKSLRVHLTCELTN